MSNMRWRTCRFFQLIFFLAHFIQFGIRFMYRQHKKKRIIFPPSNFAYHKLREVAKKISKVFEYLTFKTNLNNFVYQMYIEVHNCCCFCCCCYQRYLSLSIQRKLIIFVSISAYVNVLRMVGRAKCQSDGFCWIYMKLEYHILSTYNVMC